MNGAKLDALVEEITHSEEEVQKAALRTMDDVYRKTILRAAASLEAGGMTVQQATDLAVKDFLEQGITCIRYKHGRMVNIATYAEMALRTSNTRAMLLGEAQKRERLGIDTVLVSQYGACSDTCLPWQGIVYIDDVWQPYRGAGKNFGGTYGYSRNGRSYPLLSVAVRAGLFHPNCRHTLTTWVEGVSVRPKPMDKAKIEATSQLEAKQRRMERRVRARQKALREFVAEHGDVLRRDPWRERLVPEISQQTYYGRTFQVCPPSPDQVPVAQWEGVTDAQATNLKQAHVTLLELLKNDKNHKREAGGFLDSQFRLLDPRKGEIGHISLSNPPKDAVGTVHTHPTGETFSIKDISNFTTDPQLGIMAVVGNNGAVYILEKLPDFDFSRIYHILQNKMKIVPDFKSDAERYVTFMEDFLHEIESCGIRYRHFGAGQNGTAL